MSFAGSKCMTLLALPFLARLAWAVAPCSVPGSKCRLSTEIKEWNKISGFANRERLWDRSLLDKGLAHMGNLYHVRHLLDKLNSGKPITTTAIGSSMIHNFAGCWQTSVDALWSRGVVPNPMLYPQQGSAVPLEQWDFVWSKCSSGGYMEGFMETINQTWPNFDHIFFNNGKGGACLDLIVQGSCLSAYVPDDVDFVLLDTVTNLCNVAGSEKMIRTFLSKKTKPLIILISNGRVCMQQDPKASHACVHDCLLPLSEGKHTDEVCRETSKLGDPFNKETYDQQMANIMFYQDLAKHYNIAHLNFEDVMKAFFDSGINNTLHMSKWELAGEFYMDWVHFRKDRLGTLIVADLLVHFLERAQEALEKLPEAEQAALTYTTPGPKWGAADHTYLSRCYGLSLKEILQKTDLSSTAQDASQALKDYRPGDTFAGFWGSFDRDLKTPMSLPPLNVVESKGWEMQGYYRGQGGVVKYKPGYITRTPGSVLEFEVNSVFDQLPHGEHGEVVLTYTVSYDNWGQASVACASGCVCNGGVLEAAVNDGSRASLQRLFSFRVSQHEHCRIKVESLQNTTSGGHKFKISNVLVRAEVTI